MAISREIMALARENASISEQACKARLVMGLVEQQVASHVLSHNGNLHFLDTNQEDKVAVSYSRVAHVPPRTSRNK